MNLNLGIWWFFLLCCGQKQSDHRRGLLICIQSCVSARRGKRTEGQRGTEKEKRGQIRKEHRHLKESSRVWYESCIPMSRPAGSQATQHQQGCISLLFSLKLRLTPKQRLMTACSHCSSASELHITRLRKNTRTRFLISSSSLKNYWRDSLKNRTFRDNQTTKNGISKFSSSRLMSCGFENSCLVISVDSIDSDSAHWFWKPLILVQSLFVNE